MFLVLLPVRNAANDLSGYFESVRRFADGILALDDGSTDETPELLRQEKLVKGILHNPPRIDVAGWDDAANRNRLLAAAADFSPGWILSLDADERLDAVDGSSLRLFTQTDALPGLAYGFRCYSVSDDGLFYLPAPIWIYRLFHYEPGQRFPDQRFHFAPIPTAIPREAYLRTSFRIQHLGGFDNARRAARYEKYREVDPDRRFWPSYSALLAPVDDDLLIPWLPRAAAEPALLWDEPDTGTPHNLQSRVVIVLAENAGNQEVRTTLSVLQKSRSGDEEIVVVGDRVVAPDGPVFVPVEPGATRAERLLAGFRATAADLLLVLDAGQIVESADRAALWSALTDGYGVVRCAVAPADESRQNSQAGWMRAHWPEAPGELGTWRPVGYRRDALQELGADPLPAHLDHDADAYLLRALARKGVLIGRVAATVRDRSIRGSELGVRQSVARGRSWAEIDLELANQRAVPAIARGRRLIGDLQLDHAEVPRIALVASAIGYASRLIDGNPGEGWAMAGWPARTVAFASRAPDGDWSISISRIDFAAGVVRSVRLPEGLVRFDSSAIDGRTAHHLRDQVELAVGAPVDELVLCSPAIGVRSAQDLRRLVSPGNLAARWPQLRAEIASTVAPLQLLAIVLRVGTLPPSAFVELPIDREQPIAAAITSALDLPAASSMRDKLRAVTWA